ncbi:hypothetical protein [Pedobacter sp. MW01-1-1]|uniref:hypothetical protein n=1 Tax=Pedobacter sp. MW01-1-1 TaxID=3383027 RepID=UPI003FEFCE68
MNKTIKFVMVAVAILTGIASCKKKIVEEIPQEPVCQLSSLKATEDIRGSYTNQFTYDNNGRVIKTSNGTEINTYVYTNNLVTVTNKAGDVSEIVLKDGKATSSRSFGVATKDGIVFKQTKQYTYNESGYLTLIQKYVNGDLNAITQLFYVDGNLSKTITTFEYTGFIATTTYAYKSSLTKNTYEIADPLSDLVDYFSGGYFGQVSKNVLIKSNTALVDNNANVLNTVNVTYDYQLDDKGNTISVLYQQNTTTNIASGQPSIDNYVAYYTLSYTCK